MRELFALFVSEQEKGETNYEKESNFLSACRDYDRIACACSGGGVSSNDASKDSGKSSADTEVGVEQTAKPQAPPEDAPVGGKFVVQITPVPSHRI